MLGLLHPPLTCLLKDFFDITDQIAWKATKFDSVPARKVTRDELQDRDKFWQGIVNRYAKKEGCVLVCF